MKNKNFFRGLSLTATFALLFAFQNTANAQRFSNALEYMQHIGNQYKLIAEDTWSYTRAVAKDKSARKLEAKRKELIATTKSAKFKINRMPDWEGDEAYRDSVVAALDLSLLMLTEDYAKIVDLEEIAEQSYDFMEAYLMAKEAANEKQSRVNQAVANEQKRFAEENDITLVDSDDQLSKNLDADNEMIS